MSVLIRFKQPVLGIDPLTKKEFTSDLHRVLAAQLIQDSATSIFIDENGEILSEWPSELVLSTEWQIPEDSATLRWAKFREWRIENHPRAWTKWTEEEKDALRNEYESGLALKEIALLHERSVSAIQAELLKLGTIIWKKESDGQ